MSFYSSVLAVLDGNNYSKPKTESGKLYKLILRNFEYVQKFARNEIAMKNNLYECLICTLENNKLALEFLRAIMEKANLYLFGGAVRDYLDDDFVNFRDLDFVVEFTSSKDLRIHDFIAETNNTYYKTNRFNGYKICFDNLHIDIWELNDTWAFKQNKLEATPENLIKSVFLNMDGLAYLLNENKYLQDCDKVYQRIKQSHYLDIVLDDNPFIELNLPPSIDNEKEI